MITITKPIEDRVLVLPDEPITVTEGGIIIPEKAQEKPKTGTVILVGSGVQGKPMLCQPGDKILYGQYTGTKVDHKGVDHLLMRESDILCITAENTPIV